MFGWQNSATYGSVISYNMYWLVVIAGFLFMGWKESKQTVAAAGSDEVDSETSSEHKATAGKKNNSGATAVREVE